MTTRILRVRLKLILSTRIVAIEVCRYNHQVRRLKNVTFIFVQSVPYRKRFNQSLTRRRRMKARLRLCCRDNPFRLNTHNLSQRNRIPNYIFILKANENFISSINYSPNLPFPDSTNPVSLFQQLSEVNLWISYRLRSRGIWRSSFHNFFIGKRLISSTGSSTLVEARLILRILRLTGIKFAMEVKKIKIK